MWAPALSAADFDLFLQGLLGSHQLRVRLQIMTTNHQVLGDVSDQLQDGSVTVDGAAEITRSASLSLFDPGHVLQLDSNAPSDGVLYLDRMIGISYQVYSEAYPEIVTIPIFTGPISGASRDDDTVTVEAQGKEAMAKQPAGRTRSYSKGWYRTQIVKELLTETGETRFSIEPWTLRTADVFGVTFETDVWTLAKRMAGDRMLYYNGAGTLVMRKPLTRTVFTFRDGDGGSLLTKPQISNSTDDLHNIVRVRGGIPKGAKLPVQYTAYAPPGHPLSAQSLGRNGKARRLLLVVEDSDLLSIKDCKERAERTLATSLKTATVVAFDAIPVPMMEFGDLIGTSAAGVTAGSRLDQFTLPLRAGESMAAGYNDRRATLNKAAIRGRRR